MQRATCSLQSIASDGWGESPRIADAASILLRPSRSRRLIRWANQRRRLADPDIRPSTRVRAHVSRPDKSVAHDVRALERSGSKMDTAREEKSRCLVSLGSTAYSFTRNNLG